MPSATSSVPNLARLSIPNLLAYPFGRPVLDAGPWQCRGAGPFPCRCCHGSRKVPVPPWWLVRALDKKRRFAWPFPGTCGNGGGCQTTTMVLHSTVANTPRLGERMDSKNENENDPKQKQTILEVVILARRIGPSGWCAVEWPPIRPWSKTYTGLVRRGSILPRAMREVPTSRRVVDSTELSLLYYHPWKKSARVWEPFSKWIWDHDSCCE